MSRAARKPEEACALGALARELGSLTPRGDFEGVGAGVPLADHDSSRADRKAELGA